ncbi:MAG TPA: glycoside hydrolase family 127 protein [Candidatus Atribacteria bacterium]|nr:glycoside hydrolase family 127 protein [Candidatus Atribacteria bacterium]
MEGKDPLRTARDIPLKDIKINSGFWSGYIDLVLDKVIPYQWDALNDRVADAAPSHAIRNIRIAAGLEEGEFHGMVFQDSDVAKWLEAVGYSLAVRPDERLEQLADEVIDLLEKAQQPDGYLNTYYTIKEPGKRWTNLWECHELYCAGHLIEAGVAYYGSTGKDRLLKIVCRLADHIDSVFGPEEGKLRGYPGHQEIELALVKLYRMTGEQRYLRLAKFFIDERGREPYYFDIEYEKRGGRNHWSGNAHPSGSREYNQYHRPVRQQDKSVGHAVRAVYMYSAMADIAAETGDEELLDACRTLFDNITKKQMYITGGIGSTRHGEAFTFDYDLPNDTVYQETCASIGLIFFARRMLDIEKKGVYADVMERALYNSVLSGMALDGRSFFYCNPMEVWPEASMKNPDRNHIKPVRQKWYGCACCPPNIARFIASLGRYIYSVGPETIYVHLYAGSEVKTGLGGGEVALEQETQYPWDGRISINISKAEDQRFVLALRKPGWCTQASLRINGEECSVGSRLKDRYIYIDRVWSQGDRVDLYLDMEPVLVQAHPRLRYNAGKVAIQRGPIVYCLEQCDNGENLAALSIPAETRLETVYDSGFLGGAVLIKCQGYRTNEDVWGEDLYSRLRIDERPVTIRAVPYFMWGNREPGEMLVWIRSR